MNRNPFTKKIDPSKLERCWKCGRLFPVCKDAPGVTHCPKCVASASPVIGVPTQDLMEMEVCLKSGGFNQHGLNHANVKQPPHKFLGSFPPSFP